MEGADTLRKLDDMYMSFKGIVGDDIGARLTAMPIRQQTAIRGKKETLPGRDGFLLVPEGYQEITIKVDLAVDDNENMPDVRRWLSGSGELIFGDYPDYAFDAMILTPIPRSSIAKRLEGAKFTVTFTAQPFMHLVQERPIVLTGGKIFRGQGDVNAMPLIAVEGSGEQTLTVNSRSMLLTLTAGVPLYIDCDAGTAYTMDGETLEYAGDCVHVLDDWFELYPEEGEKNIVSFTSGITRVTITPRWRFFT